MYVICILYTDSRVICETRKKDSKDEKKTFKGPYKYTFYFFRMSWTFFGHKYTQSSTLSSQIQPQGRLLQNK